VSEDGRSTYLTVVPSVEPDSAEAMDLVERLRQDVAPDATGAEARVLVGGSPAEFVDISDETSDKLWLVIGLVLALSFVFLTVVFRSLLLPLKAIIMNLLATGASYGLLVWVFQRGHLEEMLNFQPHSIVVYLPLILFALLFGLSMDYEVFLSGAPHTGELAARWGQRVRRGRGPGAHRAAHHRGSRDHGCRVRLFRGRGGWWRLLTLILARRC
jgi:RND superfamily putative drug exporter